MGRGNYCPMGQLTDQWYIDFDRYNFTEEDDGGKYSWFDEELLDEDLGNVMTEIEERFPSFCRCEKNPTTKYGYYWYEHVWLENKLFEIGTADNQWSQAIFIREKDNLEPEQYNLAGKHFEEYRNGIQDILLDYFETISLRAGAWCSSTLTRETANA